MKKLYFTGTVLFVLVAAGCSKDILKSYDRRIIGTWRIDDVNRIGIGGGTSNLPFRDGTFTFRDDGTLTYTNAAGSNYKGTWDFKKKSIDDRYVHSLQITAVDFTNQVVLAQYYDDVNFTSTNRIKAYITSDFHTYVTHFRR